jgi:hypothetical protein
MSNSLRGFAVLDFRDDAWEIGLEPFNQPEMNGDERRFALRNELLAIVGA